jgi:hypothetical protein
MIDKLLKKHAKHFIKEDDHRNILQGINYHENGDIYLTDTHMLLAIYDAHNKDAHTVHFKTGKIMNIDYPDVRRLLETEYEDRVTMAIPHAPIIKVASQINPVGELVATDGQLLFQVRGYESFKLFLGDSDVDFQVRLNVLYFYDTLQFFKDAGIDEITISIKDSNRPISFRSGNYEILISPVRRKS